MKWRITCCVPSVEPVSTITQRSIHGLTLARQRSITCASFLTIMFRQMEVLGVAGMGKRGVGE